MEEAVGIIAAANLIDLAASLVQIWSGAVKEKKKILFWQTVMFGMQTVSMTMLGAYTGAVSNLLSILRNILCCKDRVTPLVKGLLIAAQLFVSVLFGEGTLVSWLPFVCCTVFILFMDEKDPIRFKAMVTLTFVPWVFYFFHYRSYTGAAFAAVTIAANILSLRQMIREKKEEAEQGGK